MWVADGVLYGFGEYVWVAKPPDKFYDRFPPKVWIYVKFTTKGEDLPSGKQTYLWKIWKSPLLMGNSFSIAMLVYQRVYWLSLELYGSVIKSCWQNWFISDCRLYGIHLMLLMNEVNLSNLIWSQLIMCGSGRTTVLCLVSCWTCSHPFFLRRTVSCRNSNGFYMLYYPIYSNIIYIYVYGDGSKPIILIFGGITIHENQLWPIGYLGSLVLTHSRGCWELLTQNGEQANKGKNIVCTWFLSRQCGIETRKGRIIWSRIPSSESCSGIQINSPAVVS